MKLHMHKGSKLIFKNEQFAVIREAGCSFFPAYFRLMVWTSCGWDHAQVRTREVA